MIAVRATRRLVPPGKRGARTLSDEPPPAPAALGTWVANVLQLPYPGRSVVLFTATDTLLSVVASGRALRTTIPVFQQRLPLLLLRLGLPGPWIQARADAAAIVHVARVGAETPDRRVLGSMNDLAVHIDAMARKVETFDRFDFDDVEDRLATVLLGALASLPRDYGRPVDAVATLANLRATT